MTDRFDEMAGRVQMDLAAFAMPTGTSARRVIADALRAAHAGGVDEAAATIDQLRADIEKLRDDRADLQERCNRLMAERNAAVHMVASADSEWKVRAEKAERERDEARANYAFMVKRAADQKLDGYRELGARAAAAEERAEKAERERDEALRRRTRAERVGEAVIEWASRQTAELITEYAKALERHDWKPHAELTYAIADALKEADDAE